MELDWRRVSEMVEGHAASKVFADGPCPMKVAQRLARCCETCLEQKAAASDLVVRHMDSRMVEDLAAVADRQDILLASCMVGSSHSWDRTHAFLAAVNVMWLVCCDLSACLGCLNYWTPLLPQLYLLEHCPLNFLPTLRKAIRAGKTVHLQNDSVNLPDIAEVPYSVDIHSPFVGCHPYAVEAYSAAGAPALGCFCPGYMASLVACQVGTVDPCLARRRAVVEVVDSAELATACHTAAVVESRARARFRARSCRYGCASIAMMFDAHA